MDQVVSESLVSDRFTVIVFEVLAGLALLWPPLAFTAYDILGRSANHELGIRMALGAGSAHVLRLVVGEGCGCPDGNGIGLQVFTWSGKH